MSIKKIEESRNLAEEAKSKANEMKEKELRKNNVIIYNIKENSNCSSWSEQAEKDEEEIIKLCEHVVQDKIERKEIKRFFRLGKRDFQDKDSIPCRPLLVEFVNGMTKNLIMNNTKRLKTPPEDLVGVIINHDMTMSERQQCKKLALEAKEKQDQSSGELIYRVRGLPGQMRIVSWKKGNH
jgi:hypothetical protein